MDYEAAINSQVSVRRALAFLHSHDSVVEIQVLRDCVLVVGIPAIGINGEEIPDIKIFSIKRGLVSGREILNWLGY